MSVRFEFTDVLKFQATCLMISEKTAIQAAKTAAQKGSNILAKQVRSNIPKGKTGELRRGFKKRQERSKLRGKWVYDYIPDRAKNAIFQKPIKRPGLLGGKNSKGYYPASVEFGFLARAPGSGYLFTKHVRGSNQYAEKTETMQRLPSQHIEGQHFMANAVRQSEGAVRAEMSHVLNQELDKAWRSK